MKLYATPEEFGVAILQKACEDILKDNLPFKHMHRFKLEGISEGG